MRRLSILLVMMAVFFAAAAEAANFVDNGNGTVTDNKTGLMWQQGESGSGTWDSALSYCEGLPLGGHSDWRLPNTKELESLTDDTRYNPAIDTAFFPNANASVFCSSTTYAGNPGYAWGVAFYDGGVYGYDKKYSYDLYARCVRGGQSGSLDDCTYNLSHQTNQFTSSGGEDTVTVSASSPNCQWTATESLDWVTITSDTSGTGSGSVSYTVSANSSQSSRTGNMTIAGKNFTINQDSVNSYNLTVNKSGTGTGGITSSPAGINCGSNCGASFNSGAVVSLTATPDTGSTFTGWSGSGCSGAGICIITMNAGTAVTATFTAETNYTYTVSPTTKSFKATGGKLTVKVKGIGQNCPAPLVTINDAWLSQSGAISWKNNAGTVKIVIQKNTTSQNRTGVIWIGGNAITIEETGAQCKLTSVKPSSRKFTNAGGTGNFAVVISPQDCAWNVATISDWIHLDTTEGTGNGNIVFYVDTNATGKNRTGKIDVSLATNVKKKKTLSLKQNK